MLNKTNFLAVIIGIFLYISCIKPYDVSINSAGTSTFLIVEGGIFDVDSCFIKLRFLGTSASEPSNIPIIDAQVSVIENGQNTIQFNHLNGTDVYSPMNSNFRGKIGNTYQLKIKLTDGRSFVSSSEKLPPSPTIMGINDVFVARGTSDSNIPSQFNVYVSLPPKNTENNYYYFSYINYKRAQFCATCRFGQNYNLVNNNDCNSPFKDCYDTPAGQSAGFGFYGFPCLNPLGCWNYQKISKSVIFSDSLIRQGGEVKVLVAKAPLSTFSKYFLELHQTRISKDAYKYYTLLQQAGEKTGSLFDPSPALIVGNIVNQNNPKEQVIGYFIVAGQQVKGYYVNRNKISGTSTLESPDSNLEYPDNPPNTVWVSFGTAVCPKALPSSRCVISGIRTDQRPKDWVD